MILKQDAFSFVNECYRQVTGTAMGTQIAQDYADVFMDNFK